MRQRLLTLAVLTVAVAVAGCANRRSAEPDEFRVVTIAPLTVPPEYNLRPPRPGEPRPEEIFPDQAARAALIGARTEFEGTDGEALLVARAGGGEADPFIRAIIDGESAAIVRKSTSFSNQILFWGRDSEGLGEDAVTIDAETEAERLRLSDQVTGGSDVEIEQDRSTIGKLPGL
ncbi:DUF3035 domain-containing protein [Hyphobacterium sp. HN65]|uniref:DUF3035 domain-containing protein n=1 Tax=Hyphobacterium lacteum TaxID=3116575 RepID=A0ABU7LN63_9PROT|nr:DUF3035 domain-containing protein [Hyphobacterium sp. HN65]MEE2525368.1 DUF3035 domain-containing protein [Hyphobacterium sp. HN65]